MNYDNRKIKRISSLKCLAFAAKDVDGPCGFQVALPHLAQIPHILRRLWHIGDNYRTEYGKI